MTPKSERNRRLQNYLVFYGGWILMALFETYLWASLGFLTGYLTFVIGGYIWALYHYHHTRGGEEPRGFPLRIAKHVTERHNILGLAMNGFFNGAPGVGLVETAMGRSWRSTRWRVLIVAIGYASLWCTIHALRPPSIIPIYWYPSWQAVLRIRDFISW